ncbi:MAG: PEGA domain-containing protein [Candidatus Acidiferrales bacterium]
MQAPRRPCLYAWIALVVFAPALAQQTRAGSLTITSVPSGATIEIDGAPIGVTPHTISYPSSYFHKPHTVFSSRLEHALVLHIHKEGFSSQQLTLTEGPLQWVSLTGHHQGTYFLLKQEHFDFKLEAISEAKGSSPATPSAKTGPGGEPSGALVRASLDAARAAASNVTFASDPSGAEIYIDGKFVGQTPSTISMQPGSHVVVLRASGRKNWQRDLDVLKDSQVAFHPVLELQP